MLYPSAVQKDYVPAITFNGTRITASPGLGTGNAPFVNYNTTIDLSDNLTKVWGKHTLKGGVYMQRSRKDQTSFANANGSYNFGDNPSNPYDTGFGLSNALLGVYNTFTQASAYINGQYRYWNIEQYVQDVWKVTPGLTLDFGVRGAWYQPQYDSSLQASTFVPSLYDASKAPRLYQPAITPGTTNGTVRLRSRHEHLPAVLRRRSRGPQFRIPVPGNLPGRRLRGQVPVQQSRLAVGSAFRRRLGHHRQTEHRAARRQRHLL